MCQDKNPKKDKGRFLIGDTNKQLHLPSQLIGQSYGLKEAINDFKGHAEWLDSYKIANLIRVLVPEVEETSPTMTVKSYKEAIITDNDQKVQGKVLKPLTMLIREEGNVLGELDVENYRHGVCDLQYSMVGKLRLHKGERYPRNMNLKLHLEEAWDLKDFRLIERGCFPYHPSISFGSKFDNG